MNKREKHAHILVAETAKEFAGVLYEQLMSKNLEYAQWKALHPDLNSAQLQAAFIAMVYPKLLEQARATLAKMLTTALDPALKDAISDALILDAGLRRGRHRKGAGLRLNH